MRELLRECAHLVLDSALKMSHYHGLIDIVLRDTCAQTFTQMHMLVFNGGNWR
jgi:hypothetical protein